MFCWTAKWVGLKQTPPCHSIQTNQAQDIKLTSYTLIWKSQSELLKCIKTPECFDGCSTPSNGNIQLIFKNCGISTNLKYSYMCLNKAWPQFVNSILSIHIIELKNNSTRYTFNIPLDLHSCSTWAFQLWDSPPDSPRAQLKHNQSADVLLICCCHIVCVCLPLSCVYPLQMGC